LLTIVKTVGRFVEVRFSGNPTEADVDEWTRACDACLKAIARTGKGAVCCTDLRKSALFSPAATERLISLMRGDNKALEKNAILGTGGATFTLQLQRMFRESSGETRRRLFLDVEPALTWLDESLTPVERTRLREFLQEPDPDGAGTQASPLKSGERTHHGSEARGEPGKRGLRALKGGRS
jgi:hypothetical protein